MFNDLLPVTGSILTLRSKDSLKSEGRKKHDRKNKCSLNEKHTDPVLSLCLLKIGETSSYQLNARLLRVSGKRQGMRWGGGFVAIEKRPEADLKTLYLSILTL